MLFHHYPNFGMFSCASQIQMDVEEEDLVETLNTFSKLEPFKALIFSNSPWGENQELLCSRDYFWRDSLHGLNRHNVDMYGLDFESIDEIILYIRSMSLYCVEREGKYVKFPPTPLEEYFSADEITGEYFDGKEYRQIRVIPEISDLQYLRSFKFEDLTFRGTVEFRSVCEQPVKEIMASGVLLEIMDLAKEGLQKRGFGEEKFLDPLYVRAEKLLSPAREMLEGIMQGKTLDDYIKEYGRL